MSGLVVFVDVAVKRMADGGRRTRQDAFGASRLSPMTKLFGPVPFPPLCVVDRDEAVDEVLLHLCLSTRPAGLSILLRSGNGAPQRGGYFFHLSTDQEEVRFHDFEGKLLIMLSLAEAVRLINHASGRLFDAEMLDRCQREINLRHDEEIKGEPDSLKDA